MNPQTKTLARLVTRAAELRAAGCSWEQTARKLRRPVRTVCDWRNRYKEFWSQAIAGARREAEAEARTEGLAVLRTLLRSQDEKMLRDVSSRLVSLPADDRSPPPGPGDQLRLIQLLEGMTDEQFESFLGETDVEDDPGPAAGPVALEDPPGPA